MELNDKICYLFVTCFSIYKVRGGKRNACSPSLELLDASGWPPFSALALSSSRRWHLGSLPASQICCIAVPSRLWSRVTVQASRASQKSSLTDDCNTYLTLSFRNEPGNWARERKELMWIPKPNAQQLTWDKQVAKSGPSLVENFPQLTIDIAWLIYFSGQETSSILHPHSKNGDSNKGTF